MIPVKYPHPHANVPERVTEPQIEAFSLLLWGRPYPAVRMTQRSKRVSRNAQLYLAWKETVGWDARNQGAQPMAGSLSILINIYTEREPRWDLDNVIKGLLDALNGVCWTDDRQIQHIVAHVWTGESMPRVEMSIMKGAHGV